MKLYLIKLYHVYTLPSILYGYSLNQYNGVVLCSVITSAIMEDII